MTVDKEVVGKIIDQSGCVIGKAYDDLVHPTAKSLGNTVSLIPRTVGVWLSKWEKWVINGEESIRLTAEAVREKASKIPEEKLTEPEPYVAVPVIQQLSYCYNSEELREMYANLLVASMNTDSKSDVHPAFVDIIKQITPDEAKLLKAFSKRSGYIPLVDLQVNHGSNNGYEVVFENFTTVGADACENPKNITSYIENFDRLKIVCILEDIALIDPNVYIPLENSPLVQSYKNENLPEGMSFSVKHKSFHVTSFGRLFIKVCIGK